MRRSLVSSVIGSKTRSIHTNYSLTKYVFLESAYQYDLNLQLEFSFRVNENPRKFRHFIPLLPLLVRDPLSGSLRSLNRIYKLVHFLFGLSNRTTR